jgi:hypothetical protein
MTQEARLVRPHWAIPAPQRMVPVVIASGPMREVSP